MSGIGFIITYLGPASLVTILLFLLSSLIAIIKIRKKRFEVFKDTFLSFMEILETEKFPDRKNQLEYLVATFATQDSAMLKIRDRLKGNRKDIFNQKWTQYKEKREDYKNPIQAVVIFELQRGNNELLGLINEILEIAKNN